MRMPLIAGALVAAALAAPVPASAAPGWAVIDPLATQVGCLDDMVVAPDGTVTAVWTGGADGTTALAATRPPGGTFSSPATLSTAPVSVCSAKLAVSRSGALVAVWLQRATGASWRVAAALATPAGVWGPARLLSADGKDASDPAAGIADSGEAFATWARDGRIQAIRRPAAADWPPNAEEISPFGVTSADADLAVDPQGDAFAVWTQAGLIAAATRPADGIWAADPIPSAGGAYRPSIAVGPQGLAAAIWYPGIHSTAVSTRAPGGSWTAPADMGDHSPYSDVPGIAVDPQGNVTALWTDANISGMESARRAAGASWLHEPQLFNGATLTDAYAPAVASGPSGSAIATWSANGARPPTYVEGAFRGPGASWGVVQELTSDAFTPRAGFDDEGNGVILWAETGSIGGRAFDVAGPALRGLAIPPTGFAGESAAFSVAPADRWSAVTSTKWDFGDGTSAAGPRASHSYPAAGDYRVTVTASDALGNAVSASGTISVGIRGTGGGGGTGTSSGGKRKPKPSAWILIPYSGGYRPPAGVNRRVACRATISLTLKRGRRVLQRKTVKLNRSCRFRVSFRVRRKAVGTAKQLTVIQRFHRNRALDPRTDRFTVRVPEISTAARKSA